LGYLPVGVFISVINKHKAMPLTPPADPNSSLTSSRDSISSPGSTNTTSSGYVTHVLDRSFPGVITTGVYQTPEIPIVRESCQLKWRIRDGPIGKGAGAVIFELSPGDKGLGDKVARVTQLTAENKKQFYNDITVRRHLDRLNRGKDTPQLLDSMICRKQNTKIEFGITVSRKYKGDLEWFLQTQKTDTPRNEILNTVKKQLPDMIRDLWKFYHIFHRDIHAKNILVDEATTSIKLRFIDFEKAQYIPLDQLRDLANRDFSALEIPEKILLAECLLRDQSALFDRYSMDKFKLDEFDKAVGRAFTWEQLDVAKEDTYPSNKAIRTWCQCALAGVERMIGLFKLEAEYQVAELLENLEQRLTVSKAEAKFD
jgi:hypothetical protein